MSFSNCTETYYVASLVTKSRSSSDALVLDYVFIFKYLTQTESLHAMYDINEFIHCVLN